MFANLSSKATSSKLAGGVGGSLFLAGAAITAAALILPHPSAIDVSGYWVLCGAQVVFGVLLLGFSRFNEASQRMIAPMTIVGAILAVTAALYLNGESDGGPALLNEFFYVWPALYAGYFYRGAVTAAVVIAIAIAYCVVNAIMGLPLETVLIRSLITISVVGGTAAVAHVLRRYVDALVDRLDRLARTDELTGLVNRRSFDEHLTVEFERARRVSQPLALVIGDVDHFKSINDTFGHSAGDRVLSEIGSSMGSSVRIVDTAARIGGEEFAILMPNTTATEAVETAERLRHALGRVADPAGQPIHVTFGVASTENPKCSDPDALLLAADRALYSGKARGRNLTLAYADSMRGALVGA